MSFLGLVPFNLVVFRSEVFSRYLLVFWFALALVLLPTMRFALRAIYEGLWKAGLCRRRALLIGSPAGLSGYQQLLSIQRHYGYDLVGLLVDTRPTESLPVEMEMLHLPMLGSLDEWEKSLASTGANLIVVAHPIVPDGEQWLGNSCAGASNYTSMSNFIRACWPPPI